MTMEILLRRVFVKIATHMSLLTKTHVAMKTLLSSSFSPSFILRFIPLKRFLLCRWPIRNVMLEEVCLCSYERCHLQIKRNSKLTCGHAKTCGSMIHRHVFLTLQMNVKYQKLLTKKSISKMAKMDFCIHHCCYLGGNVAWRFGP